MIQILKNAGKTIHSSTRLPLAQKINSDLKRGFKITPKFSFQQVARLSWIYTESF